MAADFAAQSEAIGFSELFCGFSGPAATRQGGLSASRDTAVVPARRVRRGGNLRRYRVVWPKQDRTAAPVPATPPHLACAEGGRQRAMWTRNTGDRIYRSHHAEVACRAGWINLSA